MEAQIDLRGLKQPKSIVWCPKPTRSRNWNYKYRRPKCLNPKPANCFPHLQDSCLFETFALPPTLSLPFSSLFLSPFLTPLGLRLGFRCRAISCWGQRAIDADRVRSSTAATASTWPFVSHAERPWPRTELSATSASSSSRDWLGQASFALLGFYSQLISSFCV